LAVHHGGRRCGSIGGREAVDQARSVLGGLMATTVPIASDLASGTAARGHPIGSLVLKRVPLGVVTVFCVAVIVYFATHVLPGDAATAILGHEATPARLALLRRQLGLNESVVHGFWSWLTAAVQGNFGQSLSESVSVTSLIGGPLQNSAVLVLLAAVISTFLGIVLGMIAAVRRDGIFDSVGSVLALVGNALPEYVIGILVIILFSINVLHLFPALSFLPPGEHIWDQPRELILPVVTLVLVCTPYIFRMTRATMIEALNSDYVEQARLKGVSKARLVTYHALPNALPAVVQVVALTLLYLAGGIVLVERVFNYPGIGNLLVNAITDRDVPVIQFLVVLLAAFYVSVNIVSDVIVLVLTPRRRYAR
jgi:peptide/nickel transport system permease protein